MLVNRGLTVAKVHHSPSDFKQMENCPGFGKFWEIKNRCQMPINRTFDSDQ